MRKYLAVVASTALLSFGGFAAAETVPTASQPNTCAPGDQAAAKAIVNSAYAHERWHHEHPLDPKRAALNGLSACLSPSERRELKKYRQKRKAGFFLYRSYRQVATVHCTKGDWGYWSQIASNTCACIGAESGFSWSADNPTSTAAGPYQILVGRIFPARSREDQLQNHRRAAEIYREQGGGAWVAPPCG